MLVSAEPMSKGAQIAIGALAVALLLGGYAATQLGELGTFRYYQTLDEFLTEGQPGDPSRVHGYVADGSIELATRDSAIATGTMFAANTSTPRPRRWTSKASQQ